MQDEISKELKPQTFQDNIDRIHNTQATGIHIRIHTNPGATINNLSSLVAEYGKAVPDSIIL